MVGAPAKIRCGMSAAQKSLITPVLDFGDPDGDINYNIIHMLVTECFSVFSHGVLVNDF